MDTKTQFENAVSQSKELTKRPSNEVLLKLYGLYKQATIGDNTDQRPTGFDFKAIAKHDAWLEQSGKDKNVCMQEYIDLMNTLS